MASSASSVASYLAALDFHGTPTAAYSSDDQPSPSPTSRRPPLSWSIVVSERASSGGAYQQALSALVPSRIREISDAATDSTANGSRNTPCASGIEPSPPG